MRRLTTLVAAAAAVFAMGSANATLLLVDDFNTPNPFETGNDTTLGNGEQLLFTDALVGQIASQRAVYQDWTTTQNIPGATKSVTVGGGANGALNIDNGAGINSVVRVQWTIDAFALPPGPTGLLFQVLFSNLGTPQLPTDLVFSFTGSGGNFAYATQVGNVVNSGEFFPVSGADALAFSQGGTLNMTISGTPAWDFAVDQFSISIPEPTSLALVGLALVGAGVAARRRKA